jgi:hypothetical protein
MSAERIAVVCYGFYGKHLRHFVRTVAKFLGGNRDALVVVVSAANLTGAEKAFSALGSNVVELPYDGKGWEFGAYQLGLDWLMARQWGGTVTFFNDTAGIHYPLRRAELAGLREFATHPPPGRPALAGHIQHASKQFAYRGEPLPAWARSNAFALSAPAIHALGGRVFIAEDFHAPFIDQSVLVLPEFLSPDLRAYIITWLVDLGKHGWRSHAGRLDPDLDLLRSKAGSIVLEKRMAALVLAAGGVLQPFGQSMSEAWRVVSDRVFYLERRISRWRKTAAVRGNGRLA